MPNRRTEYADRDRYCNTRSAQTRRYYDKTSHYEPRDWTDEETRMVMEHTIPDMELSKQLQRSVKAIQVHRSKTKKLEESL